MPLLRPFFTSHWQPAEGFFPPPIVCSSSTAWQLYAAAREDQILFRTAREQCRTPPKSAHFNALGIFVLIAIFFEVNATTQSDLRITL
jgi:hypothetical protein